MSEENKALARRFYQVFTAASMDALDEILAPDFNYATPPPNVSPDREGFQQAAAGIRTAFPDLQLEFVYQVAEGDTVATHTVARGTQKGELQGVAPTGMEVAVNGMSFMRFAGGRSVDFRGVADQMSMMRQLGAIK
jgi:predicted ester cyclase